MSLRAPLLVAATALAAACETTPPGPRTCLSDADCSAQSYCPPEGICTLDAEAPVILFTSPDASKTRFSLADPERAVFAGTVADRTLDSAAWRLDAAHDAPLALAGETFRIEVPLSADDGVAHTLFVTARDRAGNEATLPRSFTVDRRPPALTFGLVDADCSGAVCTGAVVSLSSASYRFSGTASDGSGLALAGGLTLEIDDALLPLDTANDAWSFDWTDLPLENGSQHRVRVRATDRFGNSVETSRTVWVDRVAPTATALVDGRRFVSRTAPLFRFSEPVQPTSVLDHLQPVFSGTSFGSADGVEFGFADASDLSLSSPYSLVLDAGVLDRAGNPTAAGATQRFFTERVAPADGQLVATGERPALAFDADGNPLVLLWQAEASRFALARWDGRDRFALEAFPLASVTATSSRPSFLVADSHVGDDLGLLYDVHALLEASAGSVGNGAVVYARSVHGGAFASPDTGGPYDVLGTGGRDPVLATSCRRVPQPGCDLVARFVQCGTTCDVRRNSTDLAAPRWSTPSARDFDPAGSPQDTAMSGAGLVANATAWHVPSRISLGAAGPGPVAGLELVCDTLSCAPAWMAWASDDGRSVTAACSADPLTAGAWQKNGNAGPAVAAGEVVVTLDVARVGARIAIAAGIVGGLLPPRIEIASVADDGCLAPPQPSAWSTSVFGHSPALASSSNEAWLAHVTMAGEVRVARVPLP